MFPNYDYDYEFTAKGRSFVVKVGARNEASALRTARDLAKGKAADPNPTFVRLIASTDPLAKDA